MTVKKYLTLRNVVIVLGLLTFFQITIVYLLLSDSSITANLSKKNGDSQLKQQGKATEEKVHKWDQVVNYWKISDTLGEYTFYFPQGSFLKKTDVKVSEWMVGGIPSGLRQAGYGWEIRVIQGDYLENDELAKHLKVEMKIQTNLGVNHLAKDKLKIYFQGKDEDNWLGLPTLIDGQKEIATAYYYRMGKYILLGELKCDGTDKFEPYNDSANFHPHLSPALGYFYIPSSDKYKMFSEIPQLLDGVTDEDWVLFLARKGKTYVIETNPAEGVKPEIHLKRWTERTFISTDEMKRFDNGSRLVWTPKDDFFSSDEKDNQILVKVIPAIDSVVGCSGSYSFRISEI